jgi:hypothetical protein
VKDSLVWAVEKYGEKEKEEAKEFIKNLERQGRDR